MNFLPGNALTHVTPCKASMHRRNIHWSAMTLKHKSLCPISCRFPLCLLGSSGLLWYESTRPLWPCCDEWHLDIWVLWLVRWDWPSWIWLVCPVYPMGAWSNWHLGSFDASLATLGCCLPVPVHSLSIMARIGFWPQVVFLPFCGIRKDRPVTGLLVYNWSLVLMC